MLSFVIPAHDEATLIAACVRAIHIAARCAGSPYEIIVVDDAFEAVGGFDEKLFVSEEIALSRALKKQGRFVVLKAPVLTSGRKLRTYSGREVAGLMFRIAIGGGRALRDRRQLGLWYGPRRE